MNEPFLAEGLLMTVIVRAVYEGGVLRPTKPLALPEGETVDLIITLRNSPGPQLRDPTLAEEDYARQIRTAKSLNEMFAVMAKAPLAAEDEFDVVNEINQSRRLTGFRMPDSDPAEEHDR
jgi:predicted DNA-binding antitoxin AbrB/MazE fold protein